jgi:hypothetical protein
MRRALVAAALLAAAFAGCGGGDAEVPGDYASASQLGASFRVPPGLRAGAPNAAAQGSETVSYTGGADVSVSIRAARGRGDAFDTFPGQQRAVIEAVGGGEVEGQEPLDVPGADEAYLLTAKTENRDGDEVDVASAGARRGQDVWVLSAYAKAGGDADAEAIARSLRLEAD